MCLAETNQAIASSQTLLPLVVPCNTLNGGHANVDAATSPVVLPHIQQSTITIAMIMAALWEMRAPVNTLDPIAPTPIKVSHVRPFERTR